mgnify:CR=1 FL=1
MDEFQRWFADNGDNTHRINYDLDKNSIVFDVGGYEGDFAAKIYEKYNSTVYVFEPVEEFYNLIQDRFKNVDKIKVFKYGLAAENKHVEINLDGDQSSTHTLNNSKKQTIELRKIDEVIKKLKIENIDLIKINIEGEEFPLLKYSIIKNITKKMKNIQVQFHTFINFSSQKRRAIQHKLKETHSLTYNYNFVWENWKKDE